MFGESGFTPFGSLRIQFDGTSHKKTCTVFLKFFPLSSLIVQSRKVQTTPECTDLPVSDWLLNRKKEMPSENVKGVKQDVF